MISTEQFTTLIITALLALSLFLLPVFISPQSKLARLVNHVQPIGAFLLSLQVFNFMFFFASIYSFPLFITISLFFLLVLMTLSLESFLPTKTQDVIVKDIKYFSHKGNRTCVIITNKGKFSIGDIWGNYDKGEILLLGNKKIKIETSFIFNKVININKINQTPKESYPQVITKEEIKKYKFTLIRSIINWTIGLHILMWAFVLFDLYKGGSVEIEDMVVLEVIPLLVLTPIVLLSLRDYLITRRSMV